MSCFSRESVAAITVFAELSASKAYALSREFKAPRPFLLSMVAQAAPHALLVVNWGSAGAALLSVPTREYFQACQLNLCPVSTDRTRSQVAGQNFQARNRLSRRHRVPPCTLSSILERAPARVLVLPQPPRALPHALPTSDVSFKACAAVHSSGPTDAARRAPV